MANTIENLQSGIWPRRRVLAVALGLPLAVAFLSKVKPNSGEFVSTPQNLEDRLRYLSTTQNPITDRQIFDAVADTFKTVSGENWQKMDEVHLPLKSGEITYLGHYLPFNGLPATSWIEISSPKLERDLILELREEQGRIIPYIIPDAERDIEEIVSLTQSQKQAIARRIYNGIRFSDNIEAI